jgi:hypothetical protein
MGEFNLFYILGTTALLGVLSGVGMFVGKKWGWWVSLYFFLDGAKRYITRLILIPQAIELANITGSSSYYYFREGSKATYYVLAVVYLFNITVMDYFEIDKEKRKKYIVTISGIYVLLYLISKII